MTLIPDWAPNLHPLLVHFPIAWIIAAVVVDIVGLTLPRATWAGPTAAALYPAGALSAVATYLSGRQAAAAVLVPGTAQPVVLEHWNWALATTIYFVAIAIVRLAVALRRHGLRRRGGGRSGRAAASVQHRRARSTPRQPTRCRREPPDVPVSAFDTGGRVRCGKPTSET